MFRMLLLALLPLLANTTFAQGSAAFDQYPVYTGADLGLTYSPTGSTFRIWSPPAEAAQLILYQSATGGAPISTVDMQMGKSGDWMARLKGDWKGVYYVFRVKVGGRWGLEVPDPYAKAVGINGQRAEVLDLAATDPPGWSRDVSPRFSKADRPEDAVIYELHIRDASIDSSSGIRYKGKYLGLAEDSTHNPAGLPTGLAYLHELGVTHVHLLPFFDFNSIDERSAPGYDRAPYNWGYDPLNYDAPEGSYSTNPTNPVTRITELKELVAAFHRQGLRIVMDVVFNHTSDVIHSHFNQLVPGYYYRHKANGTLSNATGCGNELASERPMMRKFMLESLLYWVREYHIDGFRFDLMGVHDIETMNLISDSLHALKPDILLYGEGWAAGTSPLPDSLRALKENVSRLHHIAVFDDDLRDGIKGSVFDAHDRGFVSGKPGMEASVEFGIAAACPQPQVRDSLVNYSRAPYATEPEQVVAYVSCHDNNTLWDKLRLSCPSADTATRARMQRLALTIVLTSQGIPFLHAGSEFLRSKNGVENSFNAPDSINAIDWNLETRHLDLVRYIEKLISIRKEHPAFRLATGSEIARDLRFDTTAPAGTIAYTLNGAAVRDTWRKVWVGLNGTGQMERLNLPAGTWRVALATGGRSGAMTGSAQVEGYGALLLYQ